VAHLREVAHQVAANEAGTANDENPHLLRLLQANLATAFAH